MVVRLMDVRDPIQSVVVARVRGVPTTRRFGWRHQHVVARVRDCRGLCFSTAMLKGRLLS